MRYKCNRNNVYFLAENNEEAEKVGDFENNIDTGFPYKSNLCLIW